MLWRKKFVQKNALVVATLPILAKARKDEVTDIINDLIDKDK